MNSLDFWKDFYGPGAECSYMEEGKVSNWTTICASHRTRKFLFFVRHLVANGNEIIKKDFIEKVNDHSNNYYHFSPTLLEIRKGITMEKYKRVKIDNIFNRCFCSNPDHSNCFIFEEPRGITIDEGIELFDMLIELGASTNLKFRKRGVDEIDKSKFDEYIKNKLKIKIM